MTNVREYIESTFPEIAEIADSAQTDAQKAAAKLAWQVIRTKSKMDSAKSNIERELGQVRPSTTFFESYAVDFAAASNVYWDLVTLIEGARRIHGDDLDALIAGVRREILRSVRYSTNNATDAAVRSLRLDIADECGWLE